MQLNESHEGREVRLRYRNREITNADLAFLRRLCARAWTKRGDLIRAVCEAWQWRQANGGPSLYACSDLLLRLEERGLIELPPPATLRAPRQRPFARLPLPPDLIPLVGLDVRDPHADLSTLCVRPIREEERLGWRLYMHRYHPLGDRPMIGEHMLYAAFVDDELVALLGWAAAAFRAPLRDAYVGWDEQTKRERLHLVTNNIRFLILPWVRVRHLASKTLALNLRRLSTDWQVAWNHPVFLAETFVDTTRYRGTCYRAANWLPLGLTAGRSKRGNQYARGGTKKAILVYPLHKHSRRWLRAERGSPPGR